MAKKGINSKFFLTVDFNFLPQVIANVEMASRGAPMKVAKKIAADAKKNAPKKTGFLRKNIKAVAGERGKTASIVSLAPYSAYQEYGTVHIAPKFFMTRAFEKHSAELGGIIIDSVVPWNVTI